MDDAKIHGGPSVRGLCGRDFLMADLRDRLGPRLSVFPKGARHRQPGDLGVAETAPSVSAALLQIAAGAPVDAASLGGVPATRTAATETTA